MNDDTDRQRCRAANFTRIARCTSGAKRVEMWACNECGALIGPNVADLHVAWHAANDRRP